LSNEQEGHEAMSRSTVTLKRDAKAIILFRGKWIKFKTEGFTKRKMIRFPKAPCQSLYEGIYTIKIKDSD